MKIVARSARWVAVVMLLLAGAAWAQGYPTKPIRWVVGFPAGSAGDILARATGPHLTEKWGQPVIVENRPGAGGNLGADVVAKAPPDGYTLLMGTVSSHSINPTLYAKMPYDAIKDFVPVTLVASAPNLLVVPPSLPVNSTAELIALAKARPGQFTFGSAGNGTTLHLSGELFKRMAGVDMVHVPYRGTPQAMPDLLSGQISLMFAPVPAVLPQVKEGRLKALAITSTNRSALLPELPTVAETGLPGFEAVAWNGVFVPAGTPEDIVRLLNREMVRIIALPELRERLTALGFDPGGNTSEQFAAKVKADMEKWAKVIRESGARVD